MLENLIAKSLDYHNNPATRGRILKIGSTLHPEAKAYNDLDELRKRLLQPPVTHRDGG